MEENKKIILIKGDNSNWYEQAIFIMRTDIAPKNVPVDFVLEAEKIINNYMQKQLKSISKPEKKAISAQCETIKNENKSIDCILKGNKNINYILNICIVLCCILLAVILYSFTA